MFRCEKQNSTNDYLCFEVKLGKVLWIGWIKYYYDKNSNPQTPGFVCSASHHKHRNQTCQLHQPWQWLRPALYTWFLAAKQ